MAVIEKRMTLCENIPNYVTAFSPLRIPYRYYLIYFHWPPRPPVLEISSTRITVTRTTSVSEVFRSREKMSNNYSERLSAHNYVIIIVVTSVASNISNVPECLQRMNTMNLPYAHCIMAYSSYNWRFTSAGVQYKFCIL